MDEESHMRPGPAVSRQAGMIGEQGTPQQSGSNVADWGHSVKSGGAQQPMENLPSASRVAGGEVLDDARDRFRTLKQDTDEYVRNHPAKAVFTALGIGFVLGMIRRR